MDEKVSKKEIKQLEAMVDKEKFPATFEYLLLHGLTSAISPWNITGKYKTPEEVYQECLKRNIKWEELLEKPPDDALL
jgi:hypothetical protein